LRSEYGVSYEKNMKKLPSYRASNTAKPQPIAAKM